MYGYFRCGNYTSVEMQIDTSKSELNDGDSDGRTPLMLACLSGHFKAARSLLALGADNSIRYKNKFPLFALYYNNYFPLLLVHWH